MTKLRPQFGLVQLFFAFTAVSFALAAVRSSSLLWYGFAAFAALCGGAAVLEHNRYAGLVALFVLIGIYVIRIVLP